MKTIKISEIPRMVKSIRFIDNDNNSLDVEQNDYWSRDTEKEYNAVTNKLDKLEFKGRGYTGYVWYDISGYNYWVVNMQEDNYAQITIRFDNDTINKSQLPALEHKINKLIDRVNSVIFY